MAEYEDREHYIPLRKSDLVDLLCANPSLNDHERDQFRQFCTMVSATLHFEYHRHFEQLKSEYAPFDPDSVTRPLFLPSPAGGEGQGVRGQLKDDSRPQLDKLFERCKWLMERANFALLDRKAIEKAMQEVSDWGLNMEVDFSVFERLEVFARGDVMGERYRRSWRNLFRQERVLVPTYQRLALILKLRPHKRLGKDINTQAVFLKLFKDVPKADLEMLLPGARMQMPRMTVYKLGGSVVGGLVFILYKVLGALWAGIATLFAAGFTAFMTLMGPLAVLGGFGFRQWQGYTSTKIKYSLKLSQSLYYQNLDNNGGVLFHLLDEAEEQECREAFLGYFYLWRLAGDNGWTSKQLDDFVEAELEKKADLKVDFEIEDALGKLERMNVVRKNGDRYVAQPIEKALESLDYTWDNFFQYMKT